MWEILKKMLVKNRRHARAGKPENQLSLAFRLHVYLNAIGEIHKLGITDYSNLAMGRTQRPYKNHCRFKYINYEKFGRYKFWDKMDAQFFFAQMSLFMSIFARKSVMSRKKFF